MVMKIPEVRLAINPRAGDSLSFQAGRWNAPARVRFQRKMFRFQWPYAFLKVVISRVGMLRPLLVIRSSFAVAMYPQQQSHAPFEA
jgi:hypothetical protein